MTFQLPSFKPAALILALMAFASVFLMTSCSKSDEETHKHVKEKLSTMPAWSDINSSVKGGEVTLKGSVKREEDRNEAEAAIKKVHGVKSVINNIDYKPEETHATHNHDADNNNGGAISTDASATPEDPILVEAKKVVEKYPGVTVEVADGELTVSGDITKSEANDIMEKLNVLKAKKVNNKLNIIKG